MGRGPLGAARPVRLYPCVSVQVPFAHYRMDLVETYAGKIKLAPIREPMHTLLLDPATLAGISQCLKSIQTDWGNIPLGSTSKHKLAFSNRVTLDFDKPYESQVCESSMTDRNSSISPMKYSPFTHADINYIVDGQTITQLFNAGKPGVDTEASIMEQLTPVLIAAMHRGEIPMFQHIYYEAAGGSLDSEAATDYLYEALYALRQDLLQRCC